AIYPSERMEMRLLRRRTSNEYVKRDRYRDPYTSRYLGRNKASYELETYYGDKREGSSNSSYIPKYSSMTMPLRRDDRLLYEDPSSDSQRK
ncbi:hypothetical protein J1N35_034347, partial [Gossypium stocksii]